MLPEPVLASIYAHARFVFPAECCGYVREGDEVVACKNAQEAGENPFAPERGADSGFAIAGAELLAFARTFDSPHPARVVYHSHPNGRAYFSGVDRAAAATPSGPVYPVQHLVVGVGSDGVTEAALFAWSVATNEFVEHARWGVAAVDVAASAAIAGEKGWSDAYNAAFARLGQHVDAGGRLDVAALDRVAGRVREAAAAVPDEARDAHREWSTARHSDLDDDTKRPGRPCPVLYADSWLRNSVNDVRHRAERWRPSK